MKKLTNLLLAGSMEERRKSSRNCSNWRSKMQFKWKSRDEGDWLINVAVLGFAQSSYEVATSGKLKEN